jgi:hypothetical protein
MPHYYDDNLQTWIETVWEEGYDYYHADGNDSYDARIAMEDALRRHDTQFFVERVQEAIGSHFTEESVLIPIIVRTIDYYALIKHLCEYIYENYDIAVVEWVKC